jgi:hypothetical protein
MAFQNREFTCTSTVGWNGGRAARRTTWVSGSETLDPTRGGWEPSAASTEALVDDGERGRHADPYVERMAQRADRAPEGGQRDY